MSIFENLVNDINYALSKKKMKNLMSQRDQIKNLNQHLLHLNSELQEKNNKIKTLNLKMLETLKKHNYHQQNLHAQKIGIKSGFQYRIKIKSDIFNAEQKQKDLNIQQEKYKNDLDKNQTELTKINNTILYYNNLQINSIFGIIKSLLILLGYIILAISPNSLFNDSTNFIIYNSTLGILIITATILTFYFDKILYKKLELGKLNFYDYMFPILLIANILMASMTSNTTENYILFIFYLLFTVSVFNILIKNELIFKKNKNYSFPLDFTIFNLPFVNFTAITLINLNSINNNLLSLIIKISYSFSVLIYLILFVWEAITNWNKEKDLKQFVFLTISIILLLTFILCAVLNFMQNFPKAVEFVVGIGGIITLLSPLYHGFKKASVNDNEIK